MGKQVVVEIDVGLARVKHHAVTIKDDSRKAIHGGYYPALEMGAKHLPLGEDVGFISAHDAGTK
jgi:hypothetical protein